MTKSRQQQAMLLLLCLIQASCTWAKVLTYDWNVTWVNRNPDGQHERPVVSVNGEWPLPVINATKGDRIIANVHNGLGNQSTSVHWHGLFQNGTGTMDGSGMVTQCDIPPGVSMTYNFTLDQSGLYWYHSHTKGQYADGLRQALVIEDPDSPYSGKYDEERVISISDWYHDQIPPLMKKFISVENPTGAEPVPNAGLINDTSEFELNVEPGKTYFLRFVNVGAFASSYLWIEGHTMRIVQIDGVWVEETEADSIYLSVAQRYGVLVTMKNDTDANYPIVTSMDTTLFDQIPKGFNWNTTGHVVYNDAATLPPAKIVESIDPYDDFKLVPFDGEKRLPDADYTVTLDLSMNNLGDGANYAMFNGISYVFPKVPTLYTSLSAGALATNPKVYGQDSQSFVLNKGDVIDLVLNNADSGRHPFHLHGHDFQVLQRSDDNAGAYNGSTAASFADVPMRRDTLIVQPQGNFVIRFVANNPGVWLFHCHLVWHFATGLAVTLVEAPLEMQKSLAIPEDHINVCKQAGVATVGNAAGNTDDYLDLSGQNMDVPELPAGFTTKGYVAMAFSCVSAVLGLLAISWYGMAPLAKEGT